MNIKQDFNRPLGAVPLALSIGMFDGVHRGHQHIIKKLNNTAVQKNLASAILTFWPHPRKVFNPNDDLKLLNSISEKKYLLKKNNLQHLFLKEFDAEFRNLTGEEFVKQILVDRLQVKHLIIGYDHTFGKNKSGDFALLKKMGPALGFVVEQVEAVHYQEYNISSTQIRNALLRNDVVLANDMLGYHYSLSGMVIHGKKIGRTIGFPTANIAVDPIKLLPKNGAYIVEVFVNNNHYKGMLSIGTNPTVNGTERTVEVYILNFNEDIYGQEISVNFREFLHPEIKFNGLDELIERLNDDKKLTEHFNF